MGGSECGPPGGTSGSARDSKPPTRPGSSLAGAGSSFFSASRGVQPIRQDTLEGVKTAREKRSERPTGGLAGVGRSTLPPRQTPSGALQCRNQVDSSSKSPAPGIALAQANSSSPPADTSGELMTQVPPNPASFSSASCSSVATASWSSPFT